jgi:hypothetical protein
MIEQAARTTIFETKRAMTLEWRLRAARSDFFFLFWRILYARSCYISYCTTVESLCFTFLRNCILYLMICLIESSKSHVNDISSATLGRRQDASVW